jgi:hypothetical protein
VGFARKVPSQQFRAVRVAGYDDAYYGHVYLKRKEYEWRKNAAGDYANYAMAYSTRRKFGEDTDAIKWYSGQFAGADVQIIDGKVKATSIARKEGQVGVAMLPPAQIHARAKRYAVKLFLSHLHDVWYREEFKKAPPLPYAIAHLGHVDFFPPPNKDYTKGDRKAYHND